MSYFAKEALGDYTVYPGHPLTLALVIMHRYQSLSQASQRTSFGWPSAVGEGDIPGAGSAIYNALELLNRIADGRTSIDDAASLAAEWWAYSEAGGHTKNIVPGQEQADRFKGAFLAKAREWLVKVSAETN